LKVRQGLARLVQLPLSTPLVPRYRLAPVIALTVTAAVADLVGSARLVAVTV
jgi:hypothetical protein